jgi:hypothetical protein
MSSDNGLTGTEQFLLIGGGITTLGACCSMILQFVLKSRCKKIKCPCGVECDRDVIDISAVEAQLGSPPSFPSGGR